MNLSYVIQLPTRIPRRPWHRPSTPCALASVAGERTHRPLLVALKFCCPLTKCGPWCYPPSRRSYNGIDFAGQAATSDEPSISFPDFLKALDAKQVQKVRREVHQNRCRMQHHDL